jgi:hypothetical protein
MSDHFCQPRSGGVNRVLGTIERPWASPRAWALGIANTCSVNPSRSLDRPIVPAILGLGVALIGGLNGR